MKTATSEAHRTEKGSALHTVLFISVLISLTLLILIGNFVRQHRYNRSGLEAIQAHYHAESGIVEWLQAENDGLPFIPEGTDETTVSLSCRDSISIRSERWGVFQRVYSRESGKSSGIRATIGYSNSDEFSAGLIVEPFPQSLIVCEDTRIFGDVMCAPQGVRAQRLQGVPYSGEKPVYGQVFKSKVDYRPKVLHARVLEILDYYRTIMDNSKQQRLSDAPISPSNEILLNHSEDIYEADLFMDTDTTLTIIGPGKLWVSNASFFAQKLNIRNEVDIILSEECSIGSIVKLKNVILFSTAPVKFQSIEAEQLQVISTDKITVEGNSKLIENSVLLSVPEQQGIGIYLNGQISISGSVCLINADNNPADWANSIEISREVKVTGLVYSHWLLDLSGEIRGSCITSRFYFYQSPTHYYNWIRNAILKQDDTQLTGIPLFFDISSTGKSVIYREQL